MEFHHVDDDQYIMLTETKAGQRVAVGMALEEDGWRVFWRLRDDALSTSLPWTYCHEKPFASRFEARQAAYLWVMQQVTKL